jgi:hypothetical protein
VRVVQTAVRVVRSAVLAAQMTRDLTALAPLRTKLAVLVPETTVGVNDFVTQPMARVLIVIDHVEDELLIFRVDGLEQP